MTFAGFRVGPTVPLSMVPPPGAGSILASSSVTDAPSLLPTASLNRTTRSHDDLTSPRKSGSGSVAVFADRYQPAPRSVVTFARRRKHYRAGVECREELPGQSHGKIVLKSRCRLLYALHGYR